METQIETWTIEKLVELKQSGMLSVNPEYQRAAVWSLSQKKKLVDSILRGYPIPLFYLHHVEKKVGPFTNNTIDVVDGQQRINAICDFAEGAFKLFHPKDDAARARFPTFIERAPCPWGSLGYRELPPDLQQRFLDTHLSVAIVKTDDMNEARDLFVRLQAGMPLNSQEKRDAWPGGFTEFVLRTGGKPEIARYPGHDFFRLTGARSPKDRGKARQLAAQMAMLYFVHFDGEPKFCDLNAKALDDFYYRNLDFAPDSDRAKEFVRVLDKVAGLLGDKNRSKLIAHEAIHLVLLVGALMHEYAPSWEAKLGDAFDSFRYNLAAAKKVKTESPSPYWTRYGQWTRVNSDKADNIQRRHEFFAEKMLAELAAIPKDPVRLFGRLEREIIYYRDQKRCATCNGTVSWIDAEIHHVTEHWKGGKTTVGNGRLVHSVCHPKGKDADAFAAVHRTDT